MEKRENSFSPAATLTGCTKQVPEISSENTSTKCVYFPPKLFADESSENDTPSIGVPGSEEKVIGSVGYTPNIHHFHRLSNPFILTIDPHFLSRDVLFHIFSPGASASTLMMPLKMHSAEPRSARFHPRFEPFPTIWFVWEKMVCRNENPKKPVKTHQTQEKTL